MDLDLIASFAVDSKEIVDAALPLAEIDRQRADFFDARACHDVGREHFGFEGDRRRFLQDERDHV